VAAKTWAIPLPIVPAPITPTDLICIRDSSCAEIKINCDGKTTEFYHKSIPGLGMITRKLAVEYPGKYRGEKTIIGDNQPPAANYQLIAGSFPVR
jgi:hypothetical protein